MVDPAPKCPIFLLPFDPMVERAAGKEGYGRKSEDSEGNSTLKAVGGCYEDQSSHERDGGHDQMDQPTPLGLGKMDFFRQFHPLTIGRFGPKALGVSDLGFPRLFEVGGVKPVLTVHARRGYYSRLLFFELSACNRVQ